MKSEIIQFIGIVGASGFPSPAADYMEDDINLQTIVQANPTATYYARVKGDSMNNSHIPDNSVVVIDKSIRPANNSVVVASIDGEKIIKHFIKTHAGLFLSPSNNAYKPIKIREGMDFAIWGVVTHVIIKLVP